MKITLREKGSVLLSLLLIIVSGSSLAQNISFSTSPHTTTAEKQPYVYRVRAQHNNNKPLTYTAST
ncbi:MAG: hypothetical protein ABW174_04035, partial [Flavitalea sp.]